mgnify:CR=1 FL=1
MKNPVSEYGDLQSRRSFLGTSGMGLGAAAYASLVARRAVAADPGLAPKPKARRIIFLFMAGAPSQVDLFDYKPELHKLFKTELPKSIRKGQRVTAMTRGKQKLVAPSTFTFARQGKSGVLMSELLPPLSASADDLCLVHSFNTNAINHDPGKTSFCTGSEIPGKPSMGSWLSYGLGRVNENLPGYVVMHARSRFPEQSLFNRLWGTGFMPSEHQGVLLRSQGDPVLYLKNPAGVTGKDRRAQLDTLAAINQAHYKQFADPEILARIQQHEMAYRMQTSVPELTDMSQESKATLDLYGPDVQKPGTFAANCLLARRMAERYLGPPGVAYAESTFEFPRAPFYVRARKFTTWNGEGFDRTFTADTTWHNALRS